MNSESEKSLLAVAEVAGKVRGLDTEKKNRFLLALAERIVKSENEILSENQKDLQLLSSQTPPAFRDRLTLTKSRLQEITQSLRDVAQLEDPVGEVVEQRVLENGLKVRKIRAPLGVILMIFESRPNVITEAFSLALKSGNTMILRGGSESAHSAHCLYSLMAQVAVETLGFVPFWGLEDYDRQLIGELLQRSDKIDIVVPRGGEKLIEFVQKTAKMPIIKNDRGLCHAYIDESADLEMALQICINAKTQRPAVCNSLETVLVHEKIAPHFFPALVKRTESLALQFFAEPRALPMLTSAGRRLQPVDARSFDTEYLDLILNCKVVDSIQEAILHIQKHSSRHSETIITNHEPNARQFQQELDSAVVYWNASTRFTDGFQLGLGGELGISTQKLHVRGPVGLKELTNLRWLIDGTGQIRT